MELWHITHIRQTKEVQTEGFSTNSIVNYNQWHLRNVHLRDHLANIDVRSNAETVVTRTGVATLTYHLPRWSRISSALLRPNFRGVVNKNAVQPTNHPVSRVFFSCSLKRSLIRPRWHRWHDITLILFFLSRLRWVSERHTWYTLENQKNETKTSKSMEK